MKNLAILFRSLLALSLMVWVSGAGWRELAQTGNDASALRVIGQVAAIDPAGNRISVKTDAGDVIAVALDANTIYLKVPPGKTTLDQAGKITVSEVAVGDRIMARGKAGEGKSIHARQVVVVSKSDLQQKRAEEQNRWRQRGVAGVITAVSPEKREISLQVRGAEGVKTVAVTVTENSRIRRYKPDSANLDDLQSGSLADLNVGDQARVLLGQAAAEGPSPAEEIVAGSFFTASGSVVSVSPETGEVRIMLRSNRQPLTLQSTKDSKLRRISPQMVALLVQKSLAASNLNAAPNPAAGKPAAGPAPKPGGEQRQQDAQELFEQAPQISVNEIKPGDVVLVSSLRGADPSKATAIAILTGVEAVLNQLQATATARARNAPNPNTGLPPGVLDMVIALP